MQLAYHNHEWQRYALMLPNCHLNSGYEADILCLRKQSWYVEEVEVKISKGDFSADFRKTVNIPHEIVGPFQRHQEWKRFKNRRLKKHQALSDGLLVSNYFSFLVPDFLVEKITVPDYAGLYSFIEQTERCRARIRHHRSPTILHRNKPSEMLAFKWARKMSNRYWALQNNLQLKGAYS